MEIENLNFVFTLSTSNLLELVNKVKAKNGLKRRIIAKGIDMTYQELYEKFIEKCHVNNRSSYTIDSYRVTRYKMGFCFLGIKN